MGTHMKFEGTLYQIAVVVRNLEAGMKHYEQILGLGPWTRVDTDYTARYRDWTGRIANRNAFAQWGEHLHLEMIEPGVGEANAMEWLRTRGEGIFHLGYATDNLDQRPGGVEACFETLETLTEDGRPAIVHLDTVDQLGYFVELAHRPLAERLSRWVASGGAEKM